MTARELQTAVIADLGELFRKESGSQPFLFKSPDIIPDEELEKLEPENLDPDLSGGLHNTRYWNAMNPAPDIEDEDEREIFLQDNAHHKHKMVPLNIFPQALPKRKTADTEDPFPYIIVRIDSGGIDSQTDPHKVALILMIGIYDDDPNNQGHVSVLEIIERIQKHYQESPVVAGMFKFTDPFNWALQDEESWPYFFGACNLNFQLPAPRTEWSKYT